MITVALGFLDNDRFQLYQERAGTAAASLVQRFSPQSRESASGKTLVHNEQYAFCWLPTDYLMRTEEHDLIAAARDYRPEIILLVGIGGSRMGTYAVHHALRHLLPADAPELWYADTVDPITTGQLYRQVAHAAATGRRITLLIISKSGTTVETRTNSTLYYELLKSYSPIHPAQVIAITDHGSALWQQAQERRWLCATIPAHLGGRFSLWSAVGTVPLALAGVDIAQLVSGITDNTSLSTDAATIAAFMMTAYEQGLLVHNSFISAPHLNGYAAWYTQLIAESLGKDSVGIIPITSVLAHDLHATFQLYMAGPQRIMTSFVRDTASPRSTLPEVTKLHQALYTAATTAYREAGLPHIIVEIDSNNSVTVGRLLHMQMIATVLLGELLQIDPFGQPDVNRYKRVMQSLL